MFNGMKGCKGCGDVSALITLVIIVILVFVCVVGGCFNKHIFGNKQYFDFKQTFNYAYISQPNGTVERVHIKAWKDWKESDAIQMIGDDDTVYYTHLNRVILSDR